MYAIIARARRRIVREDFTVDFAGRNVITGSLVWSVPHASRLRGWSEVPNDIRFQFKNFGGYVKRETSPGPNARVNRDSLSFASSGAEGMGRYRSEFCFAISLRPRLHVVF
jgi:hypothetical protein